MRYRNQGAARYISTAIGERGVMNKKLVSFALALSLLGGFLAACEGGGGGAGGGGGTSPSPETSPAESPTPATTP